PDLAFTGSGAHDPYIIYMTNPAALDGAAGAGFVGIGGTSAGAPSVAGGMTLLGPAMSANGLGNVNPQPYGLAKDAAPAFHDVTTGSNVVPCTAGTTDCPGSAPFQYGFQAGTGYDQVTGLGSLDVNAFVAGFSTLNPTATSLAAAPNPAVEG